MQTGRVWLFDLDNTLHNASPHIFPHINRSMRQYIEQHLGLDERALGVFHRSDERARARARGPVVLVGQAIQ